MKRDQTLAQIFSRDLAEAQTIYVSTSAEFDAEHKKLVRTQELVRLGAASRQELEEIEANHQVYAAHVEEARQRLLLLGLGERQVADVAAGRQASTNISIPSPLDGVVTARNVNLGQVVTSGQDLVTVTDLSSVWIEANLLENDFGAVHVGSQATITMAFRATCTAPVSPECLEYKVLQYLACRGRQLVVAIGRQESLFRHHSLRVRCRAICAYA